MQPLGHVEGDSSGDVLSLHRQSKGGAARDLDHVAPSAVGVGEDGAWMPSPVHRQPQRDGEGLEARERFVQQ